MFVNGIHGSSAVWSAGILQEIFRFSIADDDDLEDEVVCVAVGLALPRQAKAIGALTDRPTE